MDDESEVIARKPVCDELCRLCANTDKQLIPIFQGEGVEHNLSDQIKKYLPIIKVTEIDKLPLQVCYQCTSTLIAWHNFFEQCRVADSRLREILPSSEKFNQDDDPYHDYTDDFRDDSESQSPVIEKKDEASVTVSIIDSSQRMETNDIVSSIKSKEDDKSESETLCENRHSGPKVSKRYRCIMCPTSTTTKELMREHIDRVHKFLNIEDKEDNDDARTKESTAAAQKLTIIKTNLKTQSPATRAVLENGCSALVWNKTVDDFLLRSSVTYTMNAETAPLWHCLACRKPFHSVMELQEHVQRTHVKTKENQTGLLEVRMYGYCCNVCGRCFDELEYMIGHHQAVHPDDEAPTLQYLKNSTHYALLCFVCLLYYRRHDYWFGRHKCTNWLDVKALEETKKEVNKDPCFMCDVCAATFRWKCAYQYHRETLHKNVTSIDWDAISPATIPFLCDKCDRGFAVLSDFRGHVCSNTETSGLAALSAKPKVPCPQCNAMLSSRKLMLRHIKGVHEKSLRPRRLRRLGPNKSCRPSEPTIKCPFCKLKFKTAKDTLQHAHDVHNQQLSSAYYCAKCAKTFPLNQDLWHHNEIYHSGPEDAETVQRVCQAVEFLTREGPYYMCPQCSRKFADQMTYFRHYQRHQAECNYTCERCGFQTATRLALRHHARNAHNRDALSARYECDLCHKVLSTKFSLREHLAVHAGTKEFTCEKCGKNFVSRTRLQTHVRGHLFGYRSGAVTALMRRHKCPICPKDFKKKQTLRDHLAVHSGVKNESCPVCGKLFFTKLNVYLHKMQMHCTERPFKCSVCDAAFPLRSFLGRHLKKHGIVMAADADADKALADHPTDDATHPKTKEEPEEEEDEEEEEEEAEEEEEEEVVVEEVEDGDEWEDGVVEESVEVVTESS